MKGENMTDYLTLTEFIPGTKAKAQEVNANFLALKNAISQKAAIDGDSTQNFAVADATVSSHAVNKKQLDTLSDNLTTEIAKTSEKFCVKSGNTTNGLGDLFSYNLLTITPKVGGGYPNLTVADYKGTRKTFTSASTVSMSGKPDATYNIFIKPDGSIYTLNNTIYKQAARPIMLAGDVWFNISVQPFSAIKYDGTADLEFLDVPLGNVTVSGSVITAITTFPFNQNGYDVNIYTFQDKKYDYANPIAKYTDNTYTAETNGLLYWYFGNANSTATLIVNGMAYVLHYASQGQDLGFFFPIAKGQSWRVTGASASHAVKFIPQVSNI